MAVILSPHTLKSFLDQVRPLRADFTHLHIDERGGSLLAASKKNGTVLQLDIPVPAQETPQTIMLETDLLHALWPRNALDITAGERTTLIRMDDIVTYTTTPPSRRIALPKAAAIGRRRGTVRIPASALRRLLKQISFMTLNQEYFGIHLAADVKSGTLTVCAAEGPRLSRASEVFAAIQGPRKLRTELTLNSARMLARIKGHEDVTLTFGSHGIAAETPTLRLTMKDHASACPEHQPWPEEQITRAPQLPAVIFNRKKMLQALATVAVIDRRPSVPVSFSFKNQCIVMQASDVGGTADSYTEIDADTTKDLPERMALNATFLCQALRSGFSPQTKWIAMSEARPVDGHRTGMCRLIDPDHPKTSPAHFIMHLRQ